MKTRLIAMLTAGIFATSLLSAGEIHKRKEVQQKRIAQGVASGQLTPVETAKLEKKEAKLNAETRRIASDGKVTPRERARVNRQQDRLSRDIYKQKHD